MLVGTLFIKDLVLRCNIGIYPEEKAIKQDVIVNVFMWVDITNAVKNDSIEDTVNLSLVYSKLLSLAEENKFDLQETLAKKIAELCLEDKKITKIKVSTEKPHIFKFSKSAGVEIEIARS